MNLNHNRHHIYFLLLTATFFCGCGIWIYLQADLNNYLRDLNVDDSFYYFKIAQNFANGYFSTFDGSNITNGYHPLWAWLITPVYFLTNDLEAALRIIKLSEWFILALSLTFLIQSTKKTAFNTAVIFATTPFALMFTGLFIGMESSIFFLLICLTLLLCRCFYMQPSSTNTLLLGVVLALLPWARLEAVFMASAVPILLYFFYYDIDKKAFFKPCLVLFCISLASFLIYLISSKLLFDSALPISGSFKSHWSTLKFQQQGEFNLFENILTQAKNPSNLITLLISAITLPLAFKLYITSYQQNTNDKLATRLAILFILIVSLQALARFAYAVLFVHPTWSMYAWYLPPAYTLILLAPAFCLTALESTYKWIKIPPALYFYIALLIFPIMCLATFSNIQKLSKPNELTVDWEIASYHGTLWMNDNLPDDAIIGSTDSGVIGYFSNKKVINLDGLVLNKSYLTASLSDNIEGWINQQNIQYFANVTTGAPSNNCKIFQARTRSQSEFSGQCITVYHQKAPAAGQRSFKVWQYKHGRLTEAFDN